MPKHAPLVYFCSRQDYTYRDNACHNSDGT